MLKICSVLVILSAAVAGTIANVSEADCTAMEQNVAGLDCTIRRICPNGKNPAEWEPLPLTKIGTVNTKITKLQTFRIPSSVPTTAHEVFVYMYIKVMKKSTKVQTLGELCMRGTTN